MKNNIPLYITIISVFSFSCFAQKTKVSQAGKKMESTQIKRHTLSKTRPNLIKTVKLYHVEENINMKFGGHTTTYTVSDSSLVGTNDLGPNNTRVVTPRFVKEVQLPAYRPETMTDTVKPTFITDSLKPSLNTYNLGVTDSSKKHNGYIYIVMIKIYERVAEKGYKSVDIFQKLGNAYYYNADMAKAAKWYGKLFTLTSDLEPEYYYRYAQSLKAIGQNDKANEMLRKFNQLSDSKTR